MNVWRKCGWTLLAGLLGLCVVMPAQAGHALSFGGDDSDGDYLRGQAATLNGLQECTVEYWVLVDQQGEDRFGTTVSAARQGGNNEYTHFFWYPNSNEEQGLSTFMRNQWYRNGSPFPMNQWMHVAVTRESNGTIGHYINGELAQLRAMPNAPLVVQALYYGIDQDNLHGGFDEPLNGVMDELRVWDYVRSEAEINDFMNSTVDPASAGLVTYYRFDEGEGQTTADLTAFGRHAQLGEDDVEDEHDPTWVVSGAPVYDDGGNGTSNHTFYEGWTLMSVPRAPVDPDPEMVLGDDMDDITIWQLIGFNNTQGLHPLYPPPNPPDTESMVLGEGYWLGFAHSVTITADVEGTAQDEPFTWNLEFPWNMIGTPYDRIVPLEDATFEFEDETLSATDAVDAGWFVPVLHTARPQYGNQGYYNGFKQTGTFEPWHGYWFLALVDGLSMTLPVPPPDAPEQLDPQPTNELDEVTHDEWIIQIAMGIGDTLSARIEMGVHPDAGDGFDIWHDIPMPPGMPEGLNMEAFFTHEFWLPDVGERWVRDVMDPFGPGETRTWEFDVVSSDSGMVALDWTGIELPQGYSAIFHDLTSGDEVEMDGFFRWEFPAEDGSEYPFAVHVTAGATGVGEDQGPRPAEFTLKPVYPNPFNPAATVAFELDRSMPVRLRVVDATGRDVATLLEGNRAAGEHRITWAPESIASGLYFIELRAGGVTQVQKAMLLR